MFYHWEIDKTVSSVSTNVLSTFVKFPFNKGLEEFGQDVFFAVRFPLTRLWEIAGTIGLGIYENTPFWLTEYENQYLIFSELQLKKFIDPNAKRKKYPEPLLKLNAMQLNGCVVSHPLFSLMELPFITIPEKLSETITDSSKKSGLIDGIIPLNPAHHSLSYNIYNELPGIRDVLNTQYLSSTSTTPIFDETGRFTEDADILCGLKLSNAIQFITDELEDRGCLIKTRKHKTEQLQCQHCDGLSVLRPFRHWTFSTIPDSTTNDVTTSPEYWEHYDESIREDIQNAMNGVPDMPITSQRQWGHTAACVEM